MKSCATCTNSYQGPNLMLLCTLFGCVCTATTANDCTDYQREPGSDDESPAHRVWFCDKPGRGG